MILFGEDALRSGIHQFLDHYHFERNHQGLENRLIIPMEANVNREGRIERREKLVACSITTTGRHRSWASVAADASIARPGNFTAACKGIVGCCRGAVSQKS